MNSKIKGTLIIIGGHEDTEEDEAILKEVAAHATGNKPLVIVTVASQEPEAYAEKYVAVFQELGVKKVDVLDVRVREDGFDPGRIDILKNASVVFFTGGDQLRITSQIGDTPIFQCMQELLRKGVTIAGTSAGAAVMPMTMLISGAGDKSSEISAVGMAPGLGFIEDVVIDSHFAERGRIGRLIGAVSQNPRNLGIGIDEDTAIIVNQNARFKVIGSGAVYVLDGSTMTYSNLSEERPEGILTIHDIRLHVLGADDEFDLIERRPIIIETRKA